MSGGPMVDRADRYSGILHAPPVVDPSYIIFLVAILVVF